MNTKESYNIDDLQKVAMKAAQNAAVNIMAMLLEGASFENFTEKNAHVPEGEETGMTKLKARVGDMWITGGSVQQLVDKALQRKTEQEASLNESVPTVQVYCITFMNTFRAKGTIAENTRIGYLGYLKNHIYPALGTLRLNEVSADTVQNYVNQKADELAVTTIKKHFELLGQIFDCALEDGLIQKNPFKNKRLKVFGKESVPTVAYTEDEFKKIETCVLPYLEGSDLLYTAFTIYTGMRQGEICALTWEDIDMEQGLIYVTKSISWAGKNQGTVKKPKSDNGKRVIIMLPQLQVLLEKVEKNGTYLIHSATADGNGIVTHQVMTRMRERINRIAQKNGIDFLFGNRVGRHTVATFMNNADVDEKTITSQIGHHDIQFTRKQYMNPQMRQMKRSMGKLGEYMENI